MSDGRVQIDSSIDDKGFTRGLRNIQNKLKDFDASLIKTAGLGSTISLSSALVPALATATGGVMALGASFAAAGIGAGAFGIVAASALKPAIEDAENLTAAQQEARNELESFQSFWGDYVKQFESPIFEAFGTSLEALKKIFEGLEPTIQGVSGVVVDLMNEFNNALDGSGAKQFFDWLNSNASEALYNFAHIFGNTMAGMFNLIGAFSPLGAEMEEGLLDLTERFKEWSSTLAQSEGFQAFTDYIRENGPKLLDIIGNLATILVGLGKALAPVGEIALDVLQNITGLFDALLKGNPIEEFVNGLGESVTQMAEFQRNLFVTIIEGITENLPAIAGMGVQIIETLITGIIELLPLVVEVVISLATSLVNTITMYLPVIIEMGSQLLLSLIDGIVSLLPNLITTAVTLILTLATTILENLPLLIESGIEVLNALIDGIIKILPQLLETAKMLVTRIMETVVDNLPFIIDAGIELLNALIDGIIEILPDLINTATDLIIHIVEELTANLPKIIDAGIEIIVALIEGIIDAIPDLTDVLITDLIPAIVKVLSEVDLFDIGAKIIGSLIDGFTSLKIPTPHFSMSGSLDLNPAGGMSLPSFDVDWYRESSVFSKPSLMMDKKETMQEDSINNKWIQTLFPGGVLKAT